jgi:hypothetical protein
VDIHECAGALRIAVDRFGCRLDVLAVRVGLSRFRAPVVRDVHADLCPADLRAGRDRSCFPTTSNADR